MVRAMWRSRALAATAVLLALLLCSCQARMTGEMLSREVTDNDITAPVAHQEEDTPAAPEDTSVGPSSETNKAEDQPALAEVESELSSASFLSAESRQEQKIAAASLARVSASFLSSSLEKLAREKDEQEIRRQMELQDQDWESMEKESPVVALEMDSTAAGTPTPLRHKPIHMRLMTRPKFFVSHNQKKKVSKAPRFAQMLANADAAFRTENKSKSKNKQKNKQKNKNQMKHKQKQKQKQQQQHKQKQKSKQKSKVTAKKAAVKKPAPKANHRNTKHVNKRTTNNKRNHHDGSTSSHTQFESPENVERDAEALKARFVAKLADVINPMQSNTEMDRLGHEADLIQELYEVRDQAKLAEENNGGGTASGTLQDNTRASAFRFMQRATANAEAEADATSKASTRAMMRQRMFGGGTLFSTRAKDRRVETETQAQGAAAKATPSEIEDCTGCKMVWMQVEMDVGNARFVEDVQASFEHNCMDAQKSSIFYGVCEDMYDDMYAMTDDYMSSKFTVPQICSRAKMCKE